MEVKLFTDESKIGELNLGKGGHIILMKSDDQGIFSQGLTSVGLEALDSVYLRI